MDTTFATLLDSPLGPLSILGNEEAVTAITFSRPDLSAYASGGPVVAAREQLQAYFEGNLQRFSFPMAQPGTDFQQSVWRSLLGIGFGETMSYLRLAEHMAQPLAIRAIASANGKNNLAIVVPCHRVIGSNGKLVGYAGELWRKRWLLDHERKMSGAGQTLLPF